MYQSNSQRWTAVAVSLVAMLALNAPAQARGVAVDTSGGWEGFTACPEQQACAPYHLSFAIDVGRGPTHDIYVYDDGVVGLGQPVLFPGDSTS